MSGKLPRGWVECSIDSVAEIITGNTPPKKDKTNYGNKYPWVKPPDLDQDYPITKTSEFLSDKGASIARLLPAGATLVSCIGLLGKIGFAGTALSTNQQINSAVFNTDVVEPRYGFYYCKTLRQWLEINSSSTTLPIVNKGRFSQAPFLLPPINEQRRIVAKLEVLLERVNDCQKRLEKIPVILKRFRQSVLAAACSGKLTEDWRANNGVDAQWEDMTLRDIVAHLDQGWSPKCDIVASTSNDVWGVIKTTSVQPLSFLECENKRLPETLAPVPALQLNADDLLITRAGPRSRAGICCHVSTVRPKLMICDKVYRFRVKRDMSEPKYVAYYLNSPPIVEHIDTLKTGISDSGVNLTQNKFLDIPVSLPKLNEQREIISRVGELFAVVDKIEKRHANAKSQVDKLTQSILAKAFRGELVPQDPNDEPASVLLGRIRGAIKSKTVPERRRKENA